MQADEVVRLGGGLGQLGNGDGGGVGGKDAVGHQFWFRFLGNPGFQVAVFKHGFYDQVATLQILCGGCGRDAGQYFIFLGVGHAAAADFLGQQVLGVAFAFLRVLNRNILQHHFNAAAGGGVSYAGAHHAGTQDAHFPEGFFFHTIRATAAGLDGVELEPEGARHVFGHLAGGQLGKVPGFNQAAVVEVHLGAFHDCCQNPLRGRVAALGFLPQHGRGDGQFLRHGWMMWGAAGEFEAFLVPGLLALGVGFNKGTGLGDHVFR